ncbi:alpha/beta fold hydrolase [Polaromonas sp.]|uniref:alpha/beta fold hydrolase n=1 Tax=Polaromonas sp. TaxID=1869339 RepID=UPI0027357647|nr:alpha/beta hydrolase [Polaromonas sp.]MDP3754622.1 alpha/beta hydrolase [Polaromonas sp.]
MSWVLLRGLTREARHWGGLPQQLAGLPGAGQVVTLDLPGNGVFHRQLSPASVRGIMALARHQLQAQGVAPPWNLLAMSLGGMVATDWAQQHPQEVHRLVLINTSMRPFSPVTERLRPGNWPALALLAARWHNADPTERTIHRLTCNNTSSREADIAAWVHIRQTAPVSPGNAWRQLLAAAQFSSGPQAPHCPTLVLSSSADRLVNPRCSHRVADAWQAPHHSHPWAGHDLPHDDAGWVCRQLARWLAEA